VVLVVISQIKINVTNAYSGSLAWTSAWTRTTKRYPGRIISVIVNLAIALALMEGDMFSALSWILAFTNFAIAWVVVVATDITVNKGLLKLARRSRSIVAA
jgi:purine-cytosine permease-like protein